MDDMLKTKCRCENGHHSPHAGEVCDKPATEPDGYCLSCHDAAVEEMSHVLGAKNTTFPARPNRL